MRSLAGRVVIVTGASSGIGAVTASRLAAHGAIVILAARRSEQLTQVRDAIVAAGGNAIAVTADVTEDAGRAAIVDAALRVNGTIDILINNAGYGQRGAIEAVPIDRIRENFEANVFAPLALTQRVLPIMRAQRHGRIINVNSVAGRIARPYSSIYDATKHAMEALSDGLREELAPFGIDVVAIQPGFIKTEFGAVASSRAMSSDVYAANQKVYDDADASRRKYVGQPEDIAAIILEAATDPRPRTRYAAPMHARVALLLRRILSDRLFYRFILGSRPPSRSGT